MRLFQPTTYLQRQNKVTTAWLPLLKDHEYIIISAGFPIQKPGGLDQTYPFLPNPISFWLTGRRRMAEFLVFNKQSGWIEYQNPLSDLELVWEGGQIEVTSSYTLKDLKNLLFNNKNAEYYFLGDESLLPSYLNIKESLDSEKKYLIKKTIDEMRRIKDSDEVNLIKNIAQITQKAYKFLSHYIEPGKSERQIQIAYENCIFENGSEKTPYDTIVGVGTNSAILHASPGNKKVQSQDLVLIDAGADIQDYCVDITRIFWGSGSPTTQQKNIFDIVQKAHHDCIQKSISGIPWNSIHLLAAKTIAEGLKDLNIMTCSADEAINTEAISIFFPHGVGHLVGLKVRDTGHEDNLQPQKYAGARLRVDLELKENMILTVEPGCYFIPNLLSNSEIQRKYKNQINFNEAIKYLPMGGVRIEDDILIGQGSSFNLTSQV